MTTSTVPAASSSGTTTTAAAAKATSTSTTTNNRITLDLNLGSLQHLMDIIEGPAGYSADSIVIRYQAPCSIEEQDVEGDNMNLYLQLMGGADTGEDHVDASSASTASSSSSTIASNNNDNHNDNGTIQSSSTVSSSSSTTTVFEPQRQPHRHRHTTTTSHHHRRRRQGRLIRHRRALRKALDDQIWFVVTSIERFATQFRHLTVRFVGCSFPAEALAWLLERVPRITSLTLRITVHGNMARLADALAHHPNLTSVCFDHCRPSLEDVYLKDYDYETNDNNTQSNTNGVNQRTKRQRHKSHCHHHHHHHHHHRHQEEEEDYNILDKSKVATPSTLGQKKAPPPKLASLEPLLDGLAQSKTLRSLTLCHTTIAFVAPSSAESSEDNHDNNRNNNDHNDTTSTVHTSSSLSSSSHDITAWNAGASLSQLLVQCLSLEKLSLEHMPEIRDADLATMATALAHNPTLLTLSVRQCAVGPLTGRTFGTMLSTNTRLQTLDLNLHWWDGASYYYHETTAATMQGEYVATCWELGPDALTALLHGLKTNTSLKCLGLYCDTVMAYSHPAAILHLLGESVQHRTQQLCATAIETLPRIFCDEETSTTPTTTHSLLCHTNKVLEDIIVGHRSYGLSPEIEFYLNWNRAGRAYFSRRTNPSKYDWMDAILNHRDDPSVVYALVSMNPAMFG